MFPFSLNESLLGAALGRVQIEVPVGQVLSSPTSIIVFIFFILKLLIQYTCGGQMIDLSEGPDGKEIHLLFLRVYVGGERKTAKLLEVVYVFDCLDF